MQDQSTPTPPIAALYCRVSTNKQEDNYSLESQLEACRAYAVAHGYAVDDRYIYVEVGSSYTLDRPKLTELRADLDAGRFQAVIVHAFDRWSSTNKDIYRLLADLEVGNASLESVTQGVFQNSAIGRAILSQYTTGRELWLEGHKEKTQRGQRARAKTMLLPGSKPATGYLWRPVPVGAKAHGAYDPDPLTAPLVRRIYTTLAEGGSLMGLQRAFAAEGVEGPKGGKTWAVSTLRSIVTNPMYKGEPEQFRTTQVKTSSGKRKMVPTPAAERIQLPAGVVPALVTPELWQRANDQLAHNRRHSARRSATPEGFLLRGGFVVCPHCGRALGAQSYKTRYRSQPQYMKEHGCPQVSIDAPSLDAAVWERIEAIIQHPDRILDKITADLASERDPTETERAILEKRIKEVELAQRRQTLAIEAIDDDEAAAPIVLRLRQLAKELAELRVSLAELEQRRAGWATALAMAARLTEMFHAE